MRTLNPAALVAAAMLILATPGCNDSPTASDHDDVAAAIASSSQLRIPLCHRTSSGDFTQITIADAAYTTHMEHGDLAVGAYGDCPTSVTSRLTVTVDLDAAAWHSYVTVALYVMGEPYAVLDDCFATETCTYDVPTGSSAVLASPYQRTYTWSDPSCSITEWTSSCVMTGDGSVVVGEGVLFESF